MARKPKETPPAPEVPDADLSTISTDPSALVAKLVPLDIPGSVKILGRYKKDRATFASANDEVKTFRSTMNGTKKELIDKGWDRKAISWAMDLFEMDPDIAQRVLAQTFVLCRTKVLDVPIGVVNGISGDLFDPDKVYKFGQEIVAQLDPSKGLTGDALQAAKDKATEEGRAAFYAGKNVAENPYKDGPVECKIAWVTAYDIAAEKAEASDALKPTAAGNAGEQLGGHVH